MRDVESVKNFKITAYLSSPLIGEPPYLDALLTYELAFKMREKSLKYNKSTPIEQFKRLPIPLTQFDINGIKVNSCSDPIYKINTEWHDKIAKRFETDKLSLYIELSKRRTINIGGGYLRSRYNSIHVKLIDKVVWFGRGAMDNCFRLLKNIISIGYYRKIGYGIISKWEIEECEKNYSIYFDNNLMKTVPFGEDLINKKGYRKSFGACIPPYWHNENFIEIAKPI